VEGVMNVYDAAHTLAKSIKESTEYIDFVKYREIMESNNEVKKLLDEFQMKQVELQRKQVMGEELGDAEIQEAQNLFDAVNKVPNAKEYFAAEMKFNQMMGDVSKILADAMKVI